MPAKTQSLARLAAMGLALSGGLGWSSPRAEVAPERGPSVLSATRSHPRPPAGGHGVADVPGKGVYYGGRVISNVQVVPVFWTSAVDPTTQSQIGPFLTAITASPYIDWLEEYDTIGLPGQDGLAGSNQHIGRGTAVAPVTLTPMNPATSLQDADIESELLVQISSGALPAPVTDGKGNVNTLYMIEFPDSYVISLGSDYSCSSFCGYHYTFKYGKLSVPYAIMPGIGGCGGNCGTGFDWVTAIHSHELVEAITDAEAGLAYGAPTITRPLAWYDPMDNMELADICDPFVSAPGVTGGVATVAGFTVQLIWSNFAAACVAEIPICDGTTTPPSCRPCTAYDDGVACSGATPVCQTSTTAPNAGWCVGCTGDPDCKAPAPICDTTTYTCRACTSADCSAPTPVCGTAGSCVECDGTDDTACAGKTSLCDVDAGSCVGCLSNADCHDAASPACDPKTHACGPCRASSDCPKGEVCDTSKDKDQGQCVECDGDADCPHGTCDVARHACVAPKGGLDAGHDAAHHSSEPDAGDASTGSGGGCGCTTASERAPAWWSASAAGSLVALAFARRRRRRAAG